MTTQEQYDLMEQQHKRDLELLATVARVGPTVLALAEVWPELVAMLEHRTNQTARALDALRRTP